MENIFKIAKYSKVEDIFIKDGYDEFKITYLKGNKKIHQIRIVVNGCLTKRTINIINTHESYKNKILLSIKDYKYYLSKNNIVKNNLNISTLKTICIKNNMHKSYINNLIHNINHHLLIINKEESRDKLTEYNLV